MNPKGHEPNLRRANPGNRNAEKTGVHSPRRRAEEARKVQQAMANDPQGYLDQDLRDMYAEVRGFSHLLGRDLAERGVSDHRSGKPRRLSGTFLRSLAVCMELNDRIQVSLAAEAEQYDDAEPFTVAEGLSLLRKMAHDGRVSGSARVAAIRYLLEQLVELMAVAENDRDYQFFKDLSELTDEELQTELASFSQALAGERGAAELMLRKLAGQTEIQHQQLLALYQALAEELHLGEP